MASISNAQAMIKAFEKDGIYVQEDPAMLQYIFRYKDICLNVTREYIENVGPKNFYGEIRKRLFEEQRMFDIQKFANEAPKVGRVNPPPQNIDGLSYLDFKQMYERQRGMSAIEIEIKQQEAQQRFQQIASEQYQRQLAELMMQQQPTVVALSAPKKAKNKSKIKVEPIPGPRRIRLNEA